MWEKKWALPSSLRSLCKTPGLKLKFMKRTTSFTPQASGIRGGYGVNLNLSLPLLAADIRESRNEYSESVRNVRCMSRAEGRCSNTWMAFIICETITDYGYTCMETAFLWCKTRIPSLPGGHRKKGECSDNSDLTGILIPWLLYRAKIASCEAFKRLTKWVRAKCLISKISLTNAYALVMDVLFSRWNTSLLLRMAKEQ